MLTFIVDGQEIELKDIEFIGNPLVSGTVKEYICKFEFDNSWTGYAKTAVFRIEDSDVCSNCAESESIELTVLDDNTCILPTEILRPDTKLRVGIYGVKEDKVKPTVYSSPLLVRMGAVPTQAAIDPDPGIYEQILYIAEGAKEIAQSIRNDANAGEFNGKDGAGVPEGGLARQILSKKSDGSYDFEWVDSGKTYTFKQKNPSNKWIIDHNLNKFPSVTIIDSGNTITLGEVDYINQNKLIVYFSSEFSGTAYLN